jgi:hypothetical protein
MVDRWEPGGEGGKAAGEISPFVLERLAEALPV